MSLEQSDSQLEVGEPVPEFTLENFESQEVALSDLDNFDGVLIIFMCNHCPYVKAQTDEIRKLAEESKCRDAPSRLGGEDGALCRGK